MTFNTGGVRNFSPTRCSKKVGEHVDRNLHSKQNNWVDFGDRFQTENTRAYGPRTTMHTRAAGMPSTRGTPMNSLPPSRPGSRPSTQQAQMKQMQRREQFMQGWCSRFKDVNHSLPAGHPTGPSEVDMSNWRLRGHHENPFLPKMGELGPDTWATHYQATHSPQRVFVHRSRNCDLPANMQDPRAPDIGKFDKITQKSDFCYNESLLRPFMSMRLDDQEKATGYRFAGKDSQESAQWDGTMNFDSVYSTKHVKRDTASDVFLKGDSFQCTPRVGKVVKRFPL